MKRIICAILIGSFGVCALPVGRAAQTVKPASPPTQPAVYGVQPETVNVFVQYDERLFVVMAALGAAGYEAGSSGSAVSPIRQRLREHLAKLDPALRAQLTTGYRNIVGAAASTGPAGVSGFVGLSLALSPPPALAFSPRRQAFPADVSEAARLLPLIREFYARSGVSKLIEPSLTSMQEQLTAARQAVSVVLYQVLNYLHTEPILSLVRRSSSSRPADAPTKPRLRTRRLYVIINPLDETDSAYVRNDILNGADADVDRLPGDDYFVVLGLGSTLEPVQLTFVRFVLEPLAEKYALAIREQAPLIGHLAEKIAGSNVAKRLTAFSVVNDSLAQAVHTRLRRLRQQTVIEQQLAAQKLSPEQWAAEKTALEKAADDNAIVELSAHYEQGAVLVFHFYERLARAEQVGVDIASYYEDMVRGVNFERESQRASGYREARARVAARRAEPRTPVAAATSPLLETLATVDSLVKQQKLEEAQRALDELAKQYPNNARVSYAQAQLISQRARQIDPASSADEDAAWHMLMSQLEQAVQVYRRAINAASLPDEKWIVSQSHVAIGRILEFAGQIEAADDEYRKAIELGDVPGGAYAQAKERLGRRN
ncbi:MAG: hypothetical protein RMM98_13395 [Acidobacteriota bacterium]|nr:hypothetical protein [Blastocatellia bacterium]MDW8240598.1 hypothetical protein [Acidobacteriota bacterium]